jgi:8-oxo-dGTP pyrophosphatase MutT (NUDIX family)
MSGGPSAGVRRQFQIEGKLKVQQSATVICLRKISRPQPAPDIVKGNFDGTFTNSFGASRGMRFECGWQCLMGQSEVKNWLRSSADKTVTMRYAGEFKFAGGNIDKGETIIQAARRELEEEFLRPVGISSAEAVLLPFTVKQTMPVRSRSNLMFNYIALDGQNAWLRDLDVEEVNQNLAEKRERFRELVDSGEYWKLDDATKEMVAPEIHSLAWVDLDAAFRWTLSSMNTKVSHINEYQVWA